MKFAIIAASLFASTAAMAAATDHGFMTFSAENLPVISLNVTNGDAVLNTGENFSADHIATAVITSNVDTRVAIEGRGVWSDLTAFGDVAPANLLIQTTFIGSEGTSQMDHRDMMDFEEKHVLRAGVEHEYLMAVRTDKMTHVGNAVFESIIQVSAE